jgi:acetolactate synthase small subunit
MKAPTLIDDVLRDVRKRLASAEDSPRTRELESRTDILDRMLAMWEVIPPEHTKRTEVIKIVYALQAEVIDHAREGRPRAPFDSSHVW